MKISISIAAKFLLIIFLALFGIQYAYADGIMTPNPDDLSLQILSQLFGELFGYAGFSKPSEANAIFSQPFLDPFQYALMFFNKACLIAGGLFAAWAIGTGLVNTANEGTLLGKELNHPMFWVRTAAGVFFILPIFSGYCALQVIVAWVIIQSVGLADVTWKAYFNIYESEIEKAGHGMKALYSMKMPSPQTAQLAYKTFEGYVCLYGLESLKAESDVIQLGSNANDNTKIFAPENSISEVASKHDNENPTTVQFPLKNTDQNENGSGILKTVWDNITSFANSDNKKGEELNKAKNEQIAAEKKAQELELKQAISKAFTNALTGNNIYTATQEFAKNKNLTKYEDKVFYFGLQSGDKQNPESLKDICGYIDFNRTDFIKNNLMVHSDSIKNHLASKDESPAGKTEDKTVMKLKLVNDLEKDLLAKASKNVLNRKEKVLLFYQNTLKKVSNEIEKIAKEYVKEINDLYLNDKYDENPNPNKENDFYKNKDMALAKAMKRLKAQISQIENNFVNNAIKDINAQEDATKFTYENEHGSIKALKNLVNAKKDKINITVNAEKDMKSEDFIDFMSLAAANAERDGWVNAGMWYMSLARSINSVHQMFSVSPYAKWVTGVNNVDERMENVAGKLFSNSKNIDLLQSRYGLIEEWQDYIPDSGVSDMLALKSEGGNAVNSMAVLATGIDLSNMYDYQRHPVILISEMGHNLMNSSKRLLEYNSYLSAWKSNYKSIKNNEVAGANGGKGGKNKVIDPQDPLTQSTQMTSYFIGSVIIMGFMMAYYLPVVPFLIWLGAILGWLVSVVEAIFIAPLWGAMHLYPEGHKYTGKGAVGYSLLFGMVFRPALLTLGLIASMVIIQVFGSFVNYLFYTGFTISQGEEIIQAKDGLTEFIYVLAMYAVYAIFMSSLITKMFNLITIMPDHILKWIGGQSSNLSEYGNIGSNETYGKFQGLAGSAGNAYGSSIKAQAESNAIKDLKSGDNMNRIAAGKDISFGGGGKYATDADVDAGYLSTDVKGLDGNPIMVGGDGFNSMRGDSSANVPYMKMPKGMTAPATASEKQKFNYVANTAKELAENAGLSNPERFASVTASMMYNNSDAANTLDSWNSKNLFARGDYGQGANALENAQQVWESGGNIQEGFEPLNKFAQEVKGQTVSTGNVSADINRVAQQAGYSSNNYAKNLGSDAGFSAGGGIKDMVNTGSVGGVQNTSSVNIGHEIYHDWEKQPATSTAETIEVVENKTEASGSDKSIHFKH